MQRTTVEIKEPLFGKHDSFNEKFVITKISLFYFLQAGAQAQDLIKDSAGQKFVDTAGTFQKVEIEAAFPGGDNAWKKYLENNMDIDMLAKKVKMAKKEKVLVQTARIQFIVCKDGSICNVTTVNADEVDPVFKKEAERLIAISPQWKPASQDGRNVKAYRIQPITLYLTKD